MDAVFVVDCNVCVRHCQYCETCLSLVVELNVVD